MYLHVARAAAEVLPIGAVRGWSFVAGGCSALLLARTFFSQLQRS
jgi:hypothetical protein